MPPRTLALFLLILLPGCSEYNLLNSISPACGVRRTANIAYGPIAQQKLDVYQPADRKPGKRVVVFFYGGYWEYGNKNDYPFAGNALASKDFLAILPDYRKYPQVTFPAFVQDGALAVRWAHDNAARFGGDPTHIYVMGHSAGAQIAAMLTLDPQYLRAVGLNRSDIRGFAGLAGPYDFNMTGDLAKAFLVPPGATSNPAAEPINFVDGHQPPMLLLQGTCDHTVEPGNSVRLFNRVKQMGGDVTLIFYPRLGHTGIVLALAGPFRWLAPVLDDAARFFREH